MLELTHNIMGPVCGQILADMGADVFKVERPGKGDDTRHLKGFGAGFFVCFNRNKKSLAIDLKQDRGRELLLKVVEKVDVLIENFAPGTVDRLGIGAGVCRQRNPKLIYCSLKASSTEALAYFFIPIYAAVYALPFALLGYVLGGVRRIRIASCNVCYS